MSEPITSPSQFRTASEEVIVSEHARLLHEPMSLNQNVIDFHQHNLTRLAVLRLVASSRRLERLTIALIVLTVVLLLVALPPAMDAVVKLLAHL